MWVQIAGIGHQQQDPTVRFPGADVLDEKNARQWTNAEVLKGGDIFYLVSDWVSRGVKKSPGNHLRECSGDPGYTFTHPFFFFFFFFFHARAGGIHPHQPPAQSW